jgi:hypothetical protein
VKTRPGRSSSRKSRPRSLGVAYSREFLTYIARILVSSGHSPSRLAQEFADICRDLPEPKREWDAARLNYVDDLPHVIAHWHSDPQYVDSRGAPLALPAKARGPCLVELISRVMPRADPVEVVRSLRDLGGLRRVGSRYLPADRFLTFGHQRASAVAHGLTALLGMLRTLDRNMSAASTNRLLEKTAINPSFPVSALPAFHRQLRKWAAEFIWSVDTDMRRREARHKRGRTTRLGVGVFAFEDSGAPVLATGKERRQAAALGMAAPTVLRKGRQS